MEDLPVGFVDVRGLEKGRDFGPFVGRGEGLTTSRGGLSA